jgi:hypothetical protein
MSWVNRSNCEGCEGLKVNLPIESYIGNLVTNPHIPHIRTEVRRDPAPLSHLPGGTYPDLPANHLLGKTDDLAPDLPGHVPDVSTGPTPLDPPLGVVS